MSVQRNQNKPKPVEAEYQKSIARIRRLRYNSTPNAKSRA